MAKAQVISLIILVSLVWQVLVSYGEVQLFSSELRLIGFPMLDRDVICFSNLSEKRQRSLTLSRTRHNESSPGYDTSVASKTTGDGQHVSSAGDCTGGRYRRADQPRDGGTRSTPSWKDHLAESSTGLADFVVVVVVVEIFYLQHIILYIKMS